MKKHLIVYAILIVIFIGYNFLFKVDDDRTNTAINILFTSIIFGYIAYLAVVVLRRTRRKK